MQKLTASQGGLGEEDLRGGGGKGKRIGWVDGRIGWMMGGLGERGEYWMDGKEK